MISSSISEYNVTMATTCYGLRFTLPCVAFWGSAKHSNLDANANTSSVFYCKAKFTRTCDYVTHATKIVKVFLSHASPCLHGHALISCNFH